MKKNTYQSEQESQKSKDISGGQSWQCHRTPWIGSMPQLSHYKREKKGEAILFQNLFIPAGKHMMCVDTPPPALHSGLTQK